MNIRKNIFKYWGGKQQICDWVISHFPNDYENLVYIEPFCGSAVVLFNKRPSKLEYISDLDKNLFYIYRAIRERPKEFKKLLDDTLYSINELNHACDIIEGKVEVDDWLLKAWAKCVQIGLSFFGNCTRSSLSVHLNRDSAGHFRTANDRMNDANKRLKSVHVLNKDAIKVINQFDRPDVFFYLDPPYPGTSQKGYANDFTMDDFNNMCDILLHIKGRYLMSFEKKPGMTCFDDGAGERYFYSKKISRMSKRGINDCKENEATEYLMSNYKVEAPKQLSFFV